MPWNVMTKDRPTPPRGGGRKPGPAQVRVRRVPNREDGRLYGYLSVAADAMLGHPRYVSLVSDGTRWGLRPLRSRTASALKVSRRRAVTQVTLTRLSRLDVQPGTFRLVADDGGVFACEPVPSATVVLAA